MHNGDESYLNLYGDDAKKLMKSLKVGEKVSLQVSGKVEELSERESMSYVMDSEKKDKEKRCYCVRVAVASAK